MIRTFGRMTALALALSSYTFISGCGRNTTPIENRDSTGTIAFDLRLPDGRTINTFSYQITGPNGFSKTGTIDVSNSNTLSATIGGLPAGTLQLTICVIVTPERV